jgi:hypothetical protein
MSTASREQEATMNGRTKQAKLKLVGVALVLSTAWFHGGCSDDVTADDLRWRATDLRERESEQEARQPDQQEPRESAARRESRREPSFFDRLLGERTRAVTVPPGTVVQLRFSETVSSRYSSVGDAFRTTVDQDVRIADAVAIPAGSVIIGRVTEAHQPQKVGGRARLSLEFTAIELPSGESESIEAVFARRGKSENLEDAAIIAGSTLGGAVLGEAVHEGEGGVIGGILGGIGGAVAASKTRAKPVEVPAGTVMAVELVRPVTLEVPA